jgi:hypothetical protein
MRPGDLFRRPGLGYRGSIQGHSLPRMRQSEDKRGESVFLSVRADYPQMWQHKPQLWVAAKCVPFTSGDSILTQLGQVGIRWRQTGLAVEHQAKMALTFLGGA